jgi:hypothetical protein
VRFLADESCDFVVVRALRVAGHDVAAIAEISPRATDEVVLELAIRESRILLTEDKDFGQLLHANEAATGGVFPLRFPARTRADLPGAVLKLVEERGLRPLRCPPTGSGPDQSSRRLSGTARKRAIQRAYVRLRLLASTPLFSARQT